MSAHNQTGKRILLVARNLQMGGVEKNTVNLADTLVNQGHEVHILILKNRRSLAPDPRVAVHLFDIDKFNRLTVVGFIYDLITGLLLAPLLPRSNFVWRGWYGGFYFGLWLRWMERRVGTFDQIIVRGQGAFEYLWSFRDPRLFQVIVCPVEKERPRWIERFYTRLLYSGRNLVCNSWGTRNSVAEKLERCGITARSLHVIHNPVPIEAIKKAGAEEPGDLPLEPYIVHVARLTHQKNQELLLRGYAAAGIPERLVIVGSGQEESRLRQLAEELGIAAKVTFAGMRVNPYPWMRKARLFVLSSHYEGFGLVLVESMICGTPVVATESPGGIRDVLVEEQARYIAEPTVESLAIKIREALANPVAIKPGWYERFDANHVARQFLAIAGGNPQSTEVPGASVKRFKTAGTGAAKHPRSKNGGDNSVPPTAPHLTADPATPAKIPSEEGCTPRICSS